MEYTPHRTRTTVCLDAYCLTKGKQQQKLYSYGGEREIKNFQDNKNVDEKAITILLQQCHDKGTLPARKYNN